MGKDKLRRWEENKTFDHVHEPDLQEIVEGGTYMKGAWNKEVFGREAPLVVELGCGKGEYTVNLAKMYPEKNFLGVDVKGHRFWKGAKESKRDGMENVAFLRTRIEFIQQFFEEGEVSEIWLTFSDPQPKDEKGTKRITSPIFVEKRYKKMLVPGGVIHIKSDSDLIYQEATEYVDRLAYECLVSTGDLYTSDIYDLPEPDQKMLRIRTFYEQRWLKEQKTIKYIRFRP